MVAYVELTGAVGWASVSQLRRLRGRDTKSTLSVSYWMRLGKSSRTRADADDVEIDPAVYHTAASYFDLAKYPISSVNLLSGSDYIRHLADKVRAENGTKTAGAGADADLASPSDVSKWTLVVQDCFSGGSVPGEMFTRDFWQDLIEVVEHDGIVAMVCLFLLFSCACI